MASNKTISWISTINRALGIIEGVAYGLDTAQAQALEDAVRMIDETIKEMENA